ncbi:branched-chain amino acid ABC transporter permease [Acetonema longum]|uniref:Inner-membrane translocator n=1 Tax=Acetonema longum DSM 6540 TaxID=1009370 RepID=F7NI16_9FIRM|nr:branched-chain amino acid ABC transporter permease [Acetonema longum]EGO64323.1 inner-membrane translocator [Acetonema longum DSM 6540]
MDLLNPYYLQIITFMLINAILGISVYLTLAAGQLSLGNAGFMGIGAYTAALLTLKLGWPLYVVIPLGGAAAVLVALLIGLPTLRLQGIYLAIATLGFGEVMRVIFLNLEITNGALGLSGIPALSVMIGRQLSQMGFSRVAGLSLQQAGMLAVLILLAFLLVLLVVFALLLRNSRVGRAMAAIKADETAAEITGINITYYKLLAFLLGAFVAAVAGGLAAHLTYYIGPKDFAYHRAVEILIFAVLGGSDVVWGPLIGAFIVTMLPEVLRFAAEYREMIYGVILVSMMAFRPQGLIGEETIRFWQAKWGRRAAG